MRMILVLIILLSFAFHQEHEFTSEISYYQTPEAGVSFERCQAGSSPIEPDAQDDLGIDELFPSMTRIIGSYPNPFNPSTIIRFEIEHLSNVILEVYNISGNKISNLDENIYVPGIHSVTWNASEYPSEVYILRMQANHQTFSQKLMLLK
jgi:hypothetical protein